MGESHQAGTHDLQVAEDFFDEGIFGAFAARLFFYFEGFRQHLDFIEQFGSLVLDDSTGGSLHLQQMAAGLFQLVGDFRMIFCGRLVGDLLGNNKAKQKLLIRAPHRPQPALMAEIAEGKFEIYLA